MVLEQIAAALTTAGIPYQLCYWTGAPSDPYFVGTYTETGFRYEDGCTSGVVLLEGWSHSSWSDLTSASANIRSIFADFRAANEAGCVAVSYAGSQLIPSGEEGVFKIEITLDALEWAKGE